MSKSLAPYRIRYLRERYFDQVPADALHKKIAADVKVDPNTVRNWLAGKQSKIDPVRAAIGAAAFFSEHYSRRPRKPEEAAEHNPKPKEAVKAELVHFILNGTPSPFVILSNHGADFGVQLTVEHLLPFIDEARVKELLSKKMSPDDWEDVKQLQAAQAFLRGDTPNNWAMVNAVAIARPEEQELLDTAQRSQLVVLTSAAGDGKSTLMRRVALKLKERGHEVHFFAAPPIGGPFPLPPVFDVPTYVLVDGAHLASSYSELVEAVRRDSNLHVVLAARHYEWSRRKFEISDVRPIPMHVGRIDDDQAYQIACRMIAYNANPAHSTVEALKDRILSSIRGEGHPHLLAAMMSATRDQDFTGVIDDMIKAFEKGGDAAALRYVACGALTYEVSGGQVELLPYYVLQRLIAEMIGAPHETREGREQVHAKLATYGSELVPIHSGALSNLTVYDLRHPDIAHQVVERYYGGRWGIDITTPDDLASDFDDIYRADFAVARPNSRRLVTRYAPRSALAWLRSGPEHEWLTAGVAQRLMRCVCNNFDNSEAGQWGRATVFDIWAGIEARKPYSAEREQMIDDLFEEALEEAPNSARVWVNWAQLKEKRDKQSARAIFERAWSLGNREPHFLYNWASYESSLGNIGERKDPAEFTARWLFWQGWDRGKKSLQYVLEWSRLEYAQELAGEAIAKGPLSAVGLIEDAWANGLQDLLLVDQWAIIEAARGNLGDPKHPIFPSARWLLRNGTNWSGEKDRPQEEVVFDERALMNGDHVKLWAQLEIDSNNIGDWPAGEHDVTNPERFTARWIFRETWRQPISDAGIIGMWCKLEEAKGHIGDDVSNPDKYSARWIYRESYRRLSSLPLKDCEAWLSFEIRNRHIRGPADAFPAELILQEMLKLEVLPVDEFYWEARLAEAEGNLGTFENPEDGTARRLYRMCMAESDRIPSRLAKIELESPEHDNNVGREWSAEWLFKLYKERGGRASNLEAWLDQSLAHEQD